MSRNIHIIRSGSQVEIAGNIINSKKKNEKCGKYQGAAPTLLNERTLWK
jgi:hypothetical protein